MSFKIRDKTGVNKGQNLLTVVNLLVFSTKSPCSFFSLHSQNIPGLRPAKSTFFTVVK